MKLLLCVDCTLAAAGYSADEVGGFHVPEPLCRVDGNVVVDCQHEEGEGDTCLGFSTSPCDGCGSVLAGERHHAAMLQPTPELRRIYGGRYEVIHQGASVGEVRGDYEIGFYVHDANGRRNPTRFPSLEDARDAAVRIHSTQEASC